ncbi:hypothetical protein P885DRAFT_48207 [Corynascus similis CBS 632.67]
MSPGTFSFPSLPAGPPSKRNWYQELIDHPACNGDPLVIQQAYESHRQEFRQKNVDALSALPATRPRADHALLTHLSASNGDVGARNAQDVNCMVIWTRPPPMILATIERIQTRIKDALGDGVWLVPKGDIHLSVLELSHRHSIDYLRGVLRKIGTERIETMLRVPSSLDEKPSLVRPQLSFDKLGFALSVVPSIATPFTYHHLRADLQRRALESGIAIDTCYTALSAHVTIARFVMDGLLEEEGANEKFLELVKAVNRELGEEYGRVPEGAASEWRVGELELQLGYLKFGRDQSQAEQFHTHDRK